MEGTGQIDQYADERVAKAWASYIGDPAGRLKTYRKQLTAILLQHKCNKILDVACGNGIDSIMLLEEGFTVTSTDGSATMLKFPLQEKETRKCQPRFNEWKIRKANWVTLLADLELDETTMTTNDKYDAIICLGNSFPMLTFTNESNTPQKQALRNFELMLRPGGVLIIDHRNSDFILETGEFGPVSGCFFKELNDNGVKHRREVICVSEKNVTLAASSKTNSDESFRYEFNYYPYKLDDFTSLLTETFGDEPNHYVLSDFKPLAPSSKTGNYIHIISLASDN